MTNVVPLRTRASFSTSIKADPSAALAGLARSITQMSQTSFETKQEMQHAIRLLDQSNTEIRQLIGFVEDHESRVSLFAHLERIQKLLELVKLKAAAL